MCFKMGEDSQMSLKCGMEKEMGGRGAEPVVVAGLSFPLGPSGNGDGVGLRCSGAEGAVPSLGDEVRLHFLSSVNPSSTQSEALWERLVPFSTGSLLSFVCCLVPGKSGCLKIPELQGF